MLKKTMLALVITTMCFTPAANAGKIKKLIIGAGLITGGVIAYKMYHKMNPEKFVETFIDKIPESVPVLAEKPDMIPKVLDALDDLEKNPKTTPQLKEKYSYFKETILTNFPDNKETNPPQINNQSPVLNAGGNSIIQGGSLISEDEKILEKNMIAAGMGNKPDGFKAYHIVKPNSLEFSAAKKVLSNVKIGINDAINGVYLPTGKTQGIGIVHTSEIDNNTKYSIYVNKKLIEAGENKNSVEKALSLINDKLSNGNKNFD